MTKREFQLRNSEETIRFERLLDEYRQRRGLHAYRHLPLAQAHKVLVEHPEGGKLFVSLFDIQLSRTFLNEDLNTISDVLNRDIRERRSSELSILADADFFAERVDFHRACTNFVLRYRALWDKAMGALILLLCSKEYEQFCDAPSRLKTFGNIMRRTNALSEGECQKIKKCVMDFNNRFRTDEAHGSGVLRKWSLVVQDGEDNPIEDFLWASNELDECLALISFILNRLRPPEPAGGKA
jgi:hypothetical protein